MARGNFPLVRIIAIVAAAAVVLLVLSRFGRDEPANGEVWRRGLVGGEQMNLQRDGRYEVTRWSWFAADQTLESGTWVQLGEVVSLVPATGDRKARLMRKEVRKGTWYLIDPAQPADSRYERAD